ncbi:hypothetical protein A2U01_0074897 [Trifolium medium]|uniref:Uncharacterized protein n=1 Tax=Trifolium medium TaxID=97028 RepID=A0A392T0I6_9FABA|nr:hypothetical protein [Trifolium medium]
MRDNSMPNRGHTLHGETIHLQGRNSVAPPATGKHRVKVLSISIPFLEPLRVGLLPTDASIQPGERVNVRRDPMKLR